MAEENKSSCGQVNSGHCKIARHLVSLPTIVLERIDENTIKSIKTKNSAVKKPVKNAAVLKNKSTSPIKPLVKSVTSKRIENRNRGRQKNDVIERPKLQKPLKKSVNKAETVLKSNKNVNKPKIVSKLQNSAAKNILKKTMLQKKSKVVIPQAKKPKLIKKTPIKKTPFKKTPIKTTPIKTTPIKKTPQKNLKPITKTKNDLLFKKPAATDSSEDEFLYDELIDEFENALSKGSKVISEKTTNITLKPSLGNKPPTIVKGGIVKINNLPAHLKSIASPGQQLPKNEINELVSLKRPKLPQTDCPVPPKKPSPWPISMSATSKGTRNASPSKNKKSSTTSVTNSSTKSIKQKSIKNPQQKIHNTIDNFVPNMNGSNDCTVPEEMLISPSPKKHKIGPKLVSKIGPFHLPNDEDLSDEYTEVETLENLDDMDGTFSNEEPVRNTLDTAELENNVNDNPTLSTLENDDDDPNIDLLRILTDESEENTQNQLENTTNTVLEIKPCDNKNQSINENIEDETVSLSSPQENSIVIQQTEDEPKERTIYDLINEVSLNRPSWNLHIIPETNAFCIAQVTKGRLGLPTLKKCIELDAIDYKAKVYIHQYHIKRFDGIYDSEDSILALIEEIDSIKA